MEKGELPENDHRKLGQKLDLFSFHDVAPGAPFWHPKGMLIFRELEKYARKINDENGYEETSTPILVKKEVFENSGHWKHYKENMFWFKNPTDKNETLVVKPMNCPESTYIYNSRIRSFRDLPIRLAEIGRLHRNERSGTLGGLFRVRQITMDDAHIYCAPEQTEDEIKSVMQIIDNFYKMLGFKPIYVLATRPGKALGDKEAWKKAEEALANALEKSRIKYDIAKGEGAFYGPKIEVHMKDSQNRDWQLGTAQLDLVMLPEQFKLFYMDSDGKKAMPWVIHRAIFGSFERFIGILTEHYAGAFPFWLSPIQIGVLSVNDSSLPYAKNVVEEIRQKGYRVELDGRNETIGKKIREGEMKKIPYLLVIGKRETESKTVTVRERGGKDMGGMTIDSLIKIISEKNAVTV